MNDRVFSPSALIAEVNSLLEQGFSGIHVEGEITNASASGRGHLYFTLKDDHANLDCVMWASRAGTTQIRPRGRARGSRPRFADHLSPARSFPARGRRPRTAGHRRPPTRFRTAQEEARGRGSLCRPSENDRCPPLPNRVGIVTSATGAALQDMLKVLRRVSNLEVVVAPTTVQGDGAAARDRRRHRSPGRERSRRCDHRRPRRRQPRGSLGLQRRAGGARHRERVRCR